MAQAPTIEVQVHRFEANSLEELEGRLSQFIRDSLSQKTGEKSCEPPAPENYNSACESSGPSCSSPSTEAAECCGEATTSRENWAAKALLKLSNSGTLARLLAPCDTRILSSTPSAILRHMLEAAEVAARNGDAGKAVALLMGSMSYASTLAGHASNRIALNMLGDFVAAMSSMPESRRIPGLDDLQQKVKRIQEQPQPAEKLAKLAGGARMANSQMMMDLLEDGTANAVGFAILYAVTAARRVDQDGCRHISEK